VIEKILWYLFCMFIGIFLLMMTSIILIGFVKVMYYLIFQDKLFL